MQSSVQHYPRAAPPRRRISRCEGGAWNAIITYLSAGLLYGREVERPAWFTRQRKRQYLHIELPVNM